MESGWGDRHHDYQHEERTPIGERMGLFVLAGFIYLVDASSRLYHAAMGLPEKGIEKTVGKFSKGIEKVGGIEGD